MNKRFNALCDLMIYHFCDLRRPITTGKSKFARSVKLLKDEGIIENRNDIGTIADEYNQALEEYVEEHIPEFTPQYDYWGAKCLDDHKAWNATKNGKFAGDAGGFYMLFDDFNALEEYTKEKQEEMTPAC
jgi:hypothetical protein